MLKLRQDIGLHIRAGARVFGASGYDRDDCNSDNHDQADRQCNELVVWRDVHEVAPKRLSTESVALRHRPQQAAPTENPMNVQFRVSLLKQVDNGHRQGNSVMQADKLTEGHMAVYGYCRVSTIKQASEGESLDVQRRQIEGYALMHGMTLDAVVVEEGVSGSVPVSERPEAGPLFAKLKLGDVVIAPKLDRLFRSALDALQTVENLKARGVKLHLLDLGGDIAGNGLSKLFLTISAAFAEAERDRIRERISQVKADQKERGRYLGGKLPFGFRRGPAGELVSDENEQSAIREIVAMRQSGTALRAIAGAMRERGYNISHEGVAGVLRAVAFDPAN